MAKEMITLGDEVIDTVSGFKGVATGRYVFLQGCARIAVQPKVGKDGKLPECATFDEPQLKVTKKTTRKKPKRDTGGPMPYVPTSKVTPRP